MLNIEQAARAVSGEASGRSRSYARLLEARSDLRTLMEALELSDGQAPEDTDHHASIALKALREGHDPVGQRLRDALHAFDDDDASLYLAVLPRDGETERMLFDRLAAGLADRADTLLTRLREERIPVPETFVNLVWMIGRRADNGVDIKLAAVTTDRRVEEYVDGLKSHEPSAEIISERILLDHLYGLRDTVQAMVVGAMMRIRGLRRPPRSVRRPE